VLGTFYPVEFPYYADQQRSLRVADMAVEAVKFLQAKKRPFFLMVEAGLPDKASHRGQAKRAVVEVLELDHMLTELRKNLPPRTLILVTTDHNTGGLAINGPPVPLALKGDALMGDNPIIAGVSILSWATGPGADLEKANLRESVGSVPGNETNTVTVHKTPADPDFQQPAAIDGKAATHTGGDVWLLGDGPGSGKVHGYLDNTDIYRIIASAIATSGE
jgi:alkaline phosphatase